MTTGSSEFRLRKDNAQTLKLVLKRLDNQVECHKWSPNTLSRIYDIIGELRNFLDICLSELKGTGKLKRSSTTANLAVGSPEPPTKLPSPEREESTTKHGVIGGTVTKAKKPLSLMISTGGSNMMKCSDSPTDIRYKSPSKAASQSSWPNSLLSPLIGRYESGTPVPGSPISPSELFCAESMSMSPGS